METNARTQKKIACKVSRVDENWVLLLYPTVIMSSEKENESPEIWWLKATAHYINGRRKKGS